MAVGPRFGQYCTPVSAVTVDVRPARPGAAAPTVAAALAVAAGVLGWRGVDLPAQVYRVALFHRHGLTLWDSGWYGGHFTFAYSVIFPVVAGLLGVEVVAAASAALAALAFERLSSAHFGPGARAGTVAFALGTLVQVAIGQLPFLLGEALALAAVWAASRRRWPIAVALALAASLSSPLAGAFLALAAVAWMVGAWPDRRGVLAAMTVAAALPIAAGAVAFPGQGPMPFPALDFAAEGGLFVLAVLLLPRQERVLRVGGALYLVTFVVSFLVPSALGGNIERLGETLAVPILVSLAWPYRRATLAAMVVPLSLLQWGPALGAFAPGRGVRSSRVSYFAPMLAYVGAHDHPAGRLEIVPTATHWEAAYAAPSVPLARGWERQLDTADNPIFYRRGALTPAAYRAWLLDNAVRFVALPDVKLDYAAADEGALVAQGVPGLTLVWRDVHWQVYAVAQSVPIVSGPARVVELDGGEVLLDVARAGAVVVRERFTPRWAVTQGDGCAYEVPGGWLGLEAVRPGPLRVQLQLVAGTGNRC